jgi:hypothetical protein
MGFFKDIFGGEKPAEKPKAVGLPEKEEKEFFEEGEKLGQPSEKPAQKPEEMTEEEWFAKGDADSKRRDEARKE